MKNNIFLSIFIFSFIGAIFISSFFQLGISFSFFLIFLSIVIFIFGKLLAINEEKSRKIFYIFLLLLSFGFGILRYEIRDSRVFDQNLENNIGKSILIEGIISDEPQRKEGRAILIIDLKNTSNGRSDVAVSGRAIVSTDLYPEFQYGDLIKISGRFERPENFKAASSSRDFDYVSYLAKDDIFYKIDFAKVALVSTGHGNIIKTFLFKIKNAFIKNINKVIAEPQSSLLSGILIGAKTTDTDTIDTFRIAGLSHIVALSGYNITIVAKAVMSVFSFLPKTIASSFGIVSIILFVIMSGGTSTAVRAGIMSVIVLLGTITYRKYNIGRALIVALFSMVFINPKILVYDISFQLSYIATIAIVYVSPILKNRFHFITDKFGFRDIVSMTLSAQILVLPLILYKMGLLSLVALPANVFVLAFIPITMFFGFITGIIGFFWLPLSIPFAWVSYILLAYITHVADFFAGLPFSSITVSWFPAIVMTICYIFIGIWIVRENQKLKNKNQSEI